MCIMNIPFFHYWLLCKWEGIIWPWHLFLNNFINRVHNSRLVPMSGFTWPTYGKAQNLQLTHLKSCSEMIPWDIICDLDFIFIQILGWLICLDSPDQPHGELRSCKQTHPDVAGRWWPWESVWPWLDEILKELWELYVPWKTQHRCQGMQLGSWWSISLQIE